MVKLFSKRGLKINSSNYNSNEPEKNFHSSIFQNSFQVDVISSIPESFNQNIFTLGIFIDLTKAFEKTDHYILLNELSL